MDLISIGKRVREARKSLKMTQAEFGEKIGIAGPSVLNIELARNKQLQEPTLKLICKTYGFDYDWLLTGKGDMRHKSNDLTQDRINDLLEGENEKAKAVFRAFAKFSEEDWEIVQKFIDALKSDDTK